MSLVFASGAPVEVFDEIDSTSLEARRRAAKGETGPLWLLARRQIAGYGRRGAAWLHQEGDVAATFMFSLPASCGGVPQLSFVVALSVIDALRRCAPRINIAVKWPNDIISDGGKIAGLLLELLSAGPAASVVSIGIGVNIVSAPQGLEYPTARLIDAPAPLSVQPLEVLRTIDECFAARLVRWKASGFDRVRKEWLDNAFGLGERVRVKLPGEVVEGVFVDLDLDGALLLDCEGVTRKIAAGAVLPRA